MHVIDQAGLIRWGVSPCDDCYQTPGNGQLAEMQCCRIPETSPLIDGVLLKTLSLLDWGEACPFAYIMPELLPNTRRCLVQLHS